MQAFDGNEMKYSGKEVDKNVFEDLDIRSFV